MPSALPPYPRSFLPPAALSRPLVLKVPTPEVADGLEQWPGTRSLIEERLGPTLVAQENADELRKRLQALGLNLKG